MSLEVRGVCRAIVHRGRERVVLAPLDLTVERGGVLGVTGPSGSGKTSLLRLVMGLDARSGGRILVDATGGAPPEGRWSGTAMVPQEPPALDLSAAALVARWSRYRAHRGRTGIGLRLEDGMRALGLDPAGAEAPLARLSGGERRRAWCAAVAALSPSYLLLDEPSAGLDAAAGRRLAAWIRALAAGGAGVIVATHDELLLARTASRVLVLYDGELHAEGPPSAVIPAACAEVAKEGGGGAGA